MAAGRKDEDERDRSDKSWSSTPQAGEFYFDGPYMVFTEAYHLRRGWCCQSGCRHCPYRYPKPDRATTEG